MGENEQKEFEYEIKKDEFKIEEVHNLEPKSAAKLLDEIGSNRTEEFYKYRRPVLKAMALDVNALGSSKGEETETLKAISIIEDVDNKVQAILLGEELDSQVKLPPEMGEEVVVDPTTGEPMQVEGYDIVKPKAKIETEIETKTETETKKTKKTRKTKTKEKDEKEEKEIGE